MYTKYIFTILCGDKRQLEIARMLLSRGHSVRLYGIKDTHTLNGAKVFTNWKNAIEDCDVILLPLPVTRDGKTVNMSGDLQIDAISLDELYIAAKKSGCRYILGGLMPADASLKLGESVFAADYYADEVLLNKNAVPSAEGALMIAMEHTDTTIFGMPIIITGYGRIGSYLGKILYKLGAQVTVAARSEEAIRAAQTKGYETVKLGCENDKLVQSLNKCEVVFNTVPHIIFTRNILDKVISRPLYVEIASGNGGIDISAAGAMGYDVVCAPSIPAKYSPITAGRYIFETVEKIMSERGIKL